MLPNSQPPTFAGECFSQLALHSKGLLASKMELIVCGNSPSFHQLLFTTRCVKLFSYMQMIFCETVQLHADDNCAGGM